MDVPRSLMGAMAAVYEGADGRRTSVNFVVEV